jgi:tetratricopeptide (TPR) repeat protein
MLVCADAGIATNLTQSGLIVEARGKVFLKRVGWQDYRPTAVGAAVYPGDELLPEQGAQVSVLLASEETCVDDQGNKYSCPRSPNDPLIPYIISPRRTALLNALPTLRWNGVWGATCYTVSIIDTDEEDVIWEAEVRATEVPYPGEPPLNSGVDYSYSLMVEADTGASSEAEEVFDLEFWLLDEEKSQQVRSAVEQLANLKLAQEMEALARAYLYVGYELRAEAIETLEALVKEGSQNAAVYRTLGSLYKEVGLNRLALTTYSREYDLATAAKDVEEQAVAAIGLGEIYESIGNQEAAIRWLTLARDGYAASGDTQRVSELDKPLDNLNS